MPDQVLSKPRSGPAALAVFPEGPDRRVAIYVRGAVAAALGVVGILTIIATTVGGCGSGGVGGGPSMVWSSDATKAVAEDTGGGYGLAPPVGSECGAGVGSYTFTVADDKLVWHVCDSSQASAGTPFKYVDGSRVLNAGERMMLVDALETVVISTRDSCGADDSTKLLTVTRPTGSVIYRDSFYACQNQGIYVDRIDSVLGVARQLAK